MSVYVDDVLRDAAVRNGRHVVRGRWSHLLADTSRELLTVAARLGLDPSWIQQAGTPMEHFDVTAGKRLRALQFGAIPVSYQEGIQLMSTKRAGVAFDLQLLRVDPAAYRLLLEQHTALLHATPVPDGPRRVQLSRGRSRHLEPGTVSVAAPTKWANPYRPAARTPAANAAAVEHFRAYLARNPRLVERARDELAGLNLACWCPSPLPCHADVWLAIVNTTPTTEGATGQHAARASR